MYHYQLGISASEHDFVQVTKLISYKSQFMGKN